MARLKKNNKKQKKFLQQVILSTDSTKGTPVGDIAVDMLKVTLDIHLSLITKFINLSFENGSFPDDLKFAEVSSIFKKNDDLDKENYRPVSVLFNVPMVFERIMYSQTVNPINRLQKKP